MKSLKFFKPTLAITLAIVLGWLLTVRPAEAGYTITLQQVGPDVVATGSGAINLTGLIHAGYLTYGFGPGVLPGAADDGWGGVIAGRISTGPTIAGSVDSYHLGPSGPTSFGSGGGAAASSGSGDTVGTEADCSKDGSDCDRFLIVPRGYVSGTFLSNSAIYNGATLASLGVTPGTYVWTWGTGANQNFTLQIPSQPPTPTPVPTATPVVSISVSPAQIGEGDSATFQITASANTIRPVVLNYTMSGKATFGLDYGLTGAPGQNGQIVIPFGLDAVSITLTAFVDLVTEKNETAIMALQPGVGYKLSKPKKAKVIISRHATF